MIILYTKPKKTNIFRYSYLNKGDVLEASSFFKKQSFKKVFTWLLKVHSMAERIFFENAIKLVVYGIYLSPACYVPDTEKSVAIAVVQQILWI